MRIRNLWDGSLKGEILKSALGVGISRRDDDHVDIGRGLIAAKVQDDFQAVFIVESKWRHAARLDRLELDKQRVQAVEDAALVDIPRLGAT